MKVLLTVAICLVFFQLTSSWITPGDQDKIEKGIESAECLTKTLHDSIEKRSTTITKAIAEGKPSKLLQATKLLGTVADFLGPAGVAVSFIFTFFADSQFDRLSQKMTKEFEKVNNKLDQISDQINHLENFIDAKLEINKLVDNADIILNSEQKFKSILSRLKDLSPNNPDYARTKMKLMEEFHNFYENAQVDGSISTIVRMVDVDNPLPPLKEDIFTTFRENVDCDIIKLTSLLTYTEEILRRGFQQKMAYTVIKRGTNAILEEDPIKWFHKLQKGYQTSVIHCQNNVIDYAKKIVKRKGGSSAEISRSLTNIYPWLRWAVGMKTETTKIFGTNYFEFKESENRIFVVLWQDENILDAHVVDSLDGEQSRNVSEMCSDDSKCFTCNNRKIFSIRSGQVDDDIYHFKNLELEDFTRAEHLEEISAPKEMLRGNYNTLYSSSCIPHTLLRAPCSKPAVLTFLASHDCQTNSCLMDDDVYKCFPTTWSRLRSWVAAEKPNVFNPCRELHQQDVRRGVCHNIRYTSEYSVLCEEGYHGDHCEEKLESGPSDEKLEPLKKLLDERSWKGLPSLVDVWLDVYQLGDEIKGINEAIEENTDELKFIVQHRKALGNVIYIVEQYDRYMSDSEADKISGETFLHNIHSHFRQQSVFRFLFDLNDALKNKYLRYQKKKIAQSYPFCSIEYQEKVYSFKKYTEMMETVIRASLMMYIETDEFKEYIDQNEVIWKDTEKEIKKDFGLKTLWSEGSCPGIGRQGWSWAFGRPLSVVCPECPVFDDQYCSGTESFEGAEIDEFICEGEGRHPNIKKAICKETDGRLEWESEMNNKCQRFETTTTRLECISYKWSEWSAWSTCNKDCSCNRQYCIGRQRRTRKCVGIQNKKDADPSCCPSPEKTVEEKRCNDQDCCKATGKYTCKNRKCIDTDLLCDGNKDCGTNEDELNDACPGVLRSHDIIGLKNVCAEKWFSFTETKWGSLKSNLFASEEIQVIGGNNKPGAKIKGHVALKSINNNNGDKKNNPWMRCKCNGYCRRGDKEWFDIYHAYSSSRSSPITHSSTVYFERKSGCGRRLLSGRDGDYLTMDTDHKGSCERWEIKLVKRFDQY